MFALTKKEVSWLISNCLLSISYTTEDIIYAFIYPYLHSQVSSIQLSYNENHMQFVLCKIFVCENEKKIWKKKTKNKTSAIYSI